MDYGEGWIITPPLLRLTLLPVKEEGVRLCPMVPPPPPSTPLLTRNVTKKRVHAACPKYVRAS